MKLFYASGSPYARIIRVVLRETGLDSRVPEEEVTLRDPNSALLAYNPGGMCSYRSQHLKTWMPGTSPGKGI